MKKVLYSFSALLLTACAATSDQPRMSEAELGECLQPNRRVVVEVVGLVAKPPAKKPAAKPEGEAGAKPEAAAQKPEAAAPKPDADPAAKPKAAKPEMLPVEESVYVQGNHAFDPGSAVLKEGGRKEIDEFLAGIKKRAVQVNAIIISGHTDRLEAASHSKSLSEERARAVKDYLVSRGYSDKIMFWEGKEARDPVAVTKFCS